MMNFRVVGLDGLLTVLKRERVKGHPHREDYDCGIFACTLDPEGSKIELREPAKIRQEGKVQ